MFTTLLGTRLRHTCVKSNKTVELTNAYLCNMIFKGSLFCILLRYIVTAPWEYNGTTPNLKEIILGRCQDYQIILLNNHNNALYTDVDCNDTWTKFNRSFAFKDPYQLTENSYKDLFLLINNKRQLTDQALFWSGTRVVAHDISHVNSQYTTLEDTFTGYLANKLSWCGCKTCVGGINYAACAGNSTASFWSLASRSFAENADGTVTVLVNGTPDPGNTAYYRGSTFGRVELPALGKNKNVKKVIVAVIFNLGETRKEQCGEGTLVDLVDDAKKYGITDVQCEDDPAVTKFILCAKYPEDDHCQDLISDTWMIVGITFVSITGLILLLIVGYAIYQRIKG